jgi:hypothetical protein
VASVSELQFHHEKETINQKALNVCFFHEFILMILFLFLHFFPYIHGDCLEFPDNQFINECLITESVNHNLSIEHYYSECLQCKIQTLIKPENIKFEENNQCLTIELQCIQLIFTNTEIFEDFFQFHQQFIYDLFNKDNGTSQNTLHIIVKENTLEEINIEYIEKIFQLEYHAYRALFFELHIKNSIIKINRNLLNITRLSIKIILNCGDRIKPIRTIYIIHNHNITLDSEQDFCSTIFIPPSPTISSTLVIRTSPSEVLSVSHEKSKDIILIIILLTGSLLCILITCLIYCFKRIRRHYSKNNDTTSEVTSSEDSSMETPLSLNEKPKLSLKFKRPLRAMRALQLLDDDI